MPTTIPAHRVNHTPMRAAMVQPLGPPPALRWTRAAEAIIPTTNLTRGHNVSSASRTAPTTS